MLAEPLDVEALTREEYVRDEVPAHMTRYMYRFLPPAMKRAEIFYLWSIRAYNFDANLAWVAHKGSVQLVSNNPEAEFVWVKAVWYQANMAHDFDPTWVFNSAAAAGPSFGSQGYIPQPAITYYEHSPWIAQKREAMKVRPPHGTTLHTSFTDRQPLNGWLATHAVREMWQNLRDGVTAQFGGVHRPARSPNSAHYHVTSASAGRVVAHVDVSEPHVLRLYQQEVILLPKHLQLASFKDLKSAGCHGEGFKLGINLLLRQGYTVTYAMPGQIWTFHMAAVFDADLRNMSIRMDHGPDRDDMEICVAGPYASSLFQSSMDWELTDSLLGAKAFSFTSSMGTVAVSCESSAWGRVYSRNLFVDSDETMRVLQIALNVQRQQPRDRHVLQAGLVLELASILLSWLGEMRPTTDFTPLFMHLFERLRDEKRNHLIRGAAAALREVIRMFHARHLNIRSDLIIYMDEAGDERTKEILKQLGKYVVDNTGALGDTIDLHNLTMTLMISCPAYTTLDPEEIRNCHALRLLVKGLSLNTGRANMEIQLNVRLSNVTRFCRCDYLGMVYMTCDMLQTPNFKTASTEIYSNVARYIGGNTMFLSDVFAAFIADPGTFMPTQLVKKTEDTGMSSNNTTLTSFGGYGGSGSGVGFSGSNGGSAGDSSSNIVGTYPGSTSCAGFASCKQPSTPFEAMDVPEGVNTKVRMCAFNGIPTQFSPIPSASAAAALAAHTAEHDKFKCEGPPGLQLLPFEIGGKTIYYDKLMASERLHKLLDGADSRVAALFPVVGKITANIAATLGMNIKDMPVVLVICDDALGFTQSGGIYVNIGPMLREPILSTAHKQSLFFTLLHELAHRTHIPHDTHFADELARLVYFCRKCLDFL